MNSSDHRKVVAIGLDSFDAELAKRLMAEGLMPHLQKLMEIGKWVDVGSTAEIGSSSVWPTFVTGTSPQEHGHYGEWRWRPDEMDVKRNTDAGLVPFWSNLVAQGVPVGLFDVPFAPFTGIENGFEVNEWGAHDVLRGYALISPKHVEDLMAARPNHPFESEPPIPESAYRRQDLDLVHRVSVDGVRLRGEIIAELMDKIRPRLAVLVFPEFHHAAHFLWHAVEPDHPLYADVHLQSVPDLIELCTAIDEQIGRIAERVGEGDSLVVFSLHGMRAALGVPNMMGTMLRHHGLARSATWKSRTWQERKARLFAEFKRNAPDWAKDLYHRRTGLMTQLRLARATMLEQHDWEHTRAFGLPSDQYGWARVNLKGRERHGTVDPADYRSLGEEIRELAVSATSTEGEPLVSDVQITLTDQDPLTFPLPDVVVHWSDVALHDEMRPSDPGLYAPKIAASRTGQHNANAFCIATGRAGELIGDQIETEGFADLLLRALDNISE